MEQPNHPTEKHRRSSRRHSRSSDDITNDSPKKKVRKAKSSSSASKGTTPDVANKSSSIMDCIENPRRKKAKKRLDSSKTHADDLEFTLQCVKGLIQVNQEIWGRCEDCCISKGRDRTVGIQMIRMHPLSVYFEENCSRNARVLLKFQRLIKSFDCIPALPRVGEIFPLPCNDGVFPDYDRYLQNILLLDDGVLGAFLPRFQSYLESVQVFLGGIEDWCNEFIEARIFVEEMFDKDLSPGSLGLTENVEDFSRDGQLWYGEYITLLNLDDTKTMNVDFYLACQRDRKRLKAYLDFLKM
jgi:hypothetical protein